MALLLFLFCPFAAFLTAWGNLNRRSSRAVFILFSALYGYSISFRLTTADSYRIAAVFCAASDHYLKEVDELYRAGNITDMYTQAVYALVKPFSGNPKILFAVFGMVFGIFCYLSMRVLVDRMIGKRNRYFSIVFFVFFAANSLVNMNGIRFWTATWVYFYAATRFLIDGEKKWIAGVVAAPLIHFGFIIPMLLAFSYKLVGKPVSGAGLKFCFYLFVFSFVLSFVVPESLVGDVLKHNSELISSSSINRKAHAYSDFEAENESEGAGSLYRQANDAFTKFYRYVLKIAAFVLCGSIYKRFGSVRKNRATVVLFGWVLTLFCFAFLASSLMLSGTRFIVIAWLFLIYLLFRIYNVNRTRIWRRWVYLLLPVFLYQILFMFINGYRLVEPAFWWINLPYLIYEGVGFGPVDFV